MDGDEEAALMMTWGCGVMDDDEEAALRMTSSGFGRLYSPG
jgi:hypothetical protein